MSAAAPVMIMAGGTGGHIFPALAVADALRERNIPVIWLGSRNSMEAGLIPTHDIEFIGLGIKGVRGKGLLTLALMPVKLGMAVLQAMWTILQRQPRAVLGLGGFASGPGGLAAVLLRKPLYVQEQNAIPGLTNRTLARFSRCVMEGFPGSFENSSRPVLFTGNPVRQSIELLAPTGSRLAARTGAMRLLVLGGSLGARRLNEVVPEALALFDNSQFPLVCHQTGKQNLASTSAVYQELGLKVEVVDFIEDMAAKYAWADLVIARAGAITIAELAHAGLASILVPYPHAVDDHQTVNAQALTNRQAAILISEDQLSAEALQQTLQELLADRTGLIQMGEAAHTLSRPQSASTVMRVCLGEITCAGGGS